jgi:hypothetical protein
MAREDVDKILAFAGRRVATPGGARHYGQPIGSIIKPDLPGQKSLGKTKTPPSAPAKPKEQPAHEKAAAADSAEWIQNEDVTYKGNTFKVLRVMPESRRTAGGMPDPNGSWVRVVVQDPHLSKPTTISLPLEVVRKKTASLSSELDPTETLLLTRDGEIHDEDVVDYSHALEVARGLGYIVG